MLVLFVIAFIDVSSTDFDGLVVVVFVVVVVVVIVIVDVLGVCVTA